MYEVFGGVASRAFRVLWLLDEMGVAFTHHDFKPRSEEMKAVNPTGKVPAMKVDGVLMTDSVAIMQFLADKHGQFTHPAGTVERGVQDGFTNLVNETVDATLWMAARHSFIYPEERRVEGVKEACRQDFDEAMTRIAGEMKGPYLMGEEMTVPDFLLVHCLGWATSAKFEVKEKAMNEYASRARAREGFKAARARLTA